MIFKRLSICILAILIVFCMVGQVLASDIDDKKNELKNVNEDKRSTQQQLKNIKDQQNEVFSQLEVIEKDLEQKEEELVQVQKQLEENEKELEITKAELEEAIRKADEQKKLMDARLRVMYMNGPYGMLELLIGADSINALIARLETIEKILEFDTGVLHTMRELQQQVEDKKLELEQKQQEILENKENISKQKDEIENKKKEKQKFLNELQEQEEKHEQIIKELEQEAAKLEKTIKDLQEKEKQKQQGSRGGDRYNNGALGWPVPGWYNVTSGYGNRYHPIFKHWSMHTGIDIGCPYGTNIVSAGDGVVLFAGWYSSGYGNVYGNVVIVDHGGGLATFYAHNSKVVVSPGQNVKKGQVIAKAGSTGLSTGPHLHFETRINGNHRNPWNYLK